MLISQLTQGLANLRREVGHEVAMGFEDADVRPNSLSDPQQLGGISDIGCDGQVAFLLGDERKKPPERRRRGGRKEELSAQVGNDQRSVTAISFRHQGIDLCVE